MFTKWQATFAELEIIKYSKTNWEANREAGSLSLNSYRKSGDDVIGPNEMTWWKISPSDFVERKCNWVIYQ